MADAGPKRQVLMAWSSGKDSAFALARLLADPGVIVCGLLTTVTEAYDRVSMHGVRRELLSRQAGSLGLDLVEVAISAEADNAEYEDRMARALQPYRARGVLDVAFGDLFLEDVRAYREDKLAQAGMRAMFPLWGCNTGELARQIIRDGFKAVITCVDGNVLGGEFAGRDFDEALLADLPAETDPCAENGEFHTFVHDGPIFASPIAIRRGQVVLRDGRFHFCDLLGG